MAVNLEGRNPSRSGKRPACQTVPTAATMTNVLSPSLALSRPLSPFVPLCQPSSEKKSKGLFHQITKTHGTVICVSTGVVLLLLVLSVLVQVKQPRKKVMEANRLVDAHVSVARGRQTEREALLLLFIYYLEVLVRKSNLFHRGDLQEVFDPPHYELFTLRDKVSVVAGRDVIN